MVPRKQGTRKLEEKKIGNVRRAPERYILESGIELPCVYYLWPKNMEN